MLRAILNRLAHLVRHTCTETHNYTSIPDDCQHLLWVKGLSCVCVSSHYNSGLYSNHKITLREKDQEFYINDHFYVLYRFT